MDIIDLIVLTCLVCGIFATVGFLVWLITFVHQVYENKRNISGLFDYLGLETTVFSTNIVKKKKIKK